MLGGSGRIEGVGFEDFEQLKHDGEPLVMLDWKVMFCPEHLEPYRADWPKGYPLAMVAMFQAAASDDRISVLCGGDPQRLNSVLREHAPLCEFLPVGLTEEITAMSLKGELWKHSALRGDNN